ncbi:ATPase [Psychrobacillus sp.]|uniref:ATPase n=1 Tax=Psychrobacillus sp. TaxID=1871623 RepID=UPI0028BD4EC3|nr:ATPase [Psychrobacillus sp.]
MNKSLLLPLLSSLGTMVLLYVIGFIFNIAALEFKVFQNEPLKDGSILDAEIALLPIAIGLVVGFSVERIVKIRNKKLN